MVSGGLALGLEEDREAVENLVSAIHKSWPGWETNSRASLPSHALKGSRSLRRSEVGATATEMEERSAGGA